MASVINFIDKNRRDYESLSWCKDDVDDFIKGKEIINVETKKDFIRFWYKQE